VCPRPKRQLNCVISALENSASKALSEQESRIAEIFGDDGKYADILEFEGSFCSPNSLRSESPLRVSAHQSPHQSPQSPLNGTSMSFEFGSFCDEDADAARSIAISPPLRALNPVVSDLRFVQVLQAQPHQDQDAISKCSSSYEEQLHLPRLKVTC